ncbi:MAG: glycosyltransferase [Eubacteriales bacterium]|nr:glycosyltransferase [Eubacteriales bacterium]
MRIAVLAHFQNDDTPSASYVHAQARAYRALGHDVVEIAPVPYLPPGRRWQKRRALYAQFTGCRFFDGIPVYYPRMLSLSGGVSQQVNGYLMYRAVLGLVRRLHAQQPFDMLHAHMLEREGYAASLLKNRLGISAVVTTHGTDCLKYFLPRPKRYLLEACRDVDRVVAVSQKLKDVLDSWLPAEQTVVIHNGYAPAGITPPDVRRGVLFAGNLIAQKRADLLLRAYAAICEDFPGQDLTIAGRGQQLPALQALAARLGIAHRVTFTGYLDNKELQRRMAGSLVFALPSVREGFGIVYVEAMANGCVPVGVRGEGIDGVIRPGENGILVPPDDEPALGAAVARLLRDDAYRRELSAQARCDAAQMTWAHNARAYVRLFAQILGEKKP